MTVTVWAFRRGWLPDGSGSARGVDDEAADGLHRQPVSVDDQIVDKRVIPLALAGEHDVATARGVALVNALPCLVGRDAVATGHAGDPVALGRDDVDVEGARVEAEDHLPAAAEDDDVLGVGGLADDLRGDVGVGLLIDRLTLDPEEQRANECAGPVIGLLVEPTRGRDRDAGARGDRVDQVAVDDAEAKLGGDEVGDAGAAAAELPGNRDGGHGASSFVPGCGGHATDRYCYFDSALPPVSRQESAGQLRSWTIACRAIAARPIIKAITAEKCFRRGWKSLASARAGGDS